MPTMQTGKVTTYNRTNFGNSSIAIPNHTFRNNPLDLVPKHYCTVHSVEYDCLTGSICALSIYCDFLCNAGAFLHNADLLWTGGAKEGNRTIRFVNTGPTSRRLEQGSPHVPLCEEVVCHQPDPANCQRHLSGHQGAEELRIEPKSMKSQENLRMLWSSSNKRNTKNSLHLLVNLLPDGNLFIFGNIFSYVFIYKTGVIVKDMPIFWVGPLQPPIMWNCSPAAALSTEWRSWSAGADQGNKQSYQTAPNTCGRNKPYDTNVTWAVENMPGPIEGDGRWNAFAQRWVSKCLSAFVTHMGYCHIS